MVRLLGGREWCPSSWETGGELDERTTSTAGDRAWGGSEECSTGGPWGVTTQGRGAGAGPREALLLHSALSPASGLQSRWRGWSADLQGPMENIHHSRHRQRPQPVCPCPQRREPSSCAVSRPQSCHRTGRGRTPPFFPAWRPGSQTPSFHGSYILRCFFIVSDAGKYLVSVT